MNYVAVEYISFNIKRTYKTLYLIDFIIGSYKNGLVASVDRYYDNAFGLVLIFFLDYSQKWQKTETHKSLRATMKM